MTGVSSRKKPSVDVQWIFDYPKNNDIIEKNERDLGSWNIQCDTWWCVLNFAVFD